MWLDLHFRYPFFYFSCVLLPRLPVVAGVFALVAVATQRGFV